MGLCIKAAEKQGRETVEAEQSAKVVNLQASHDLELTALRLAHERDVKALKAEIDKKTISLENAEMDLRAELEAHTTVHRPSCMSMYVKLRSLPVSGRPPTPIWITN